jgi:hypothetical protein
MLREEWVHMAKFRRIEKRMGEGTGREAKRGESIRSK